MKIDKVLKRKFIAFSVLITFFFVSSSTVRAQQYSIKDRWNVKFDYSGYHSLGFELSGSNANSPSFQIDLNYGVLNFLETGVYCGYGKVRTSPKIISSEYNSIIKAETMFYGLNANVHLLPFLVQSTKFRFDLYASGKLGGFYRFSEEGMYPGRGHVWDYGMYLGAAYYMGRHLGVFGEYGIGNYTNSRFGLSMKF